MNILSMCDVISILILLLMSNIQSVVISMKEIF